MKLTRILALLMALLMTLSFAACKKTTDEPQADNPEPAVTQEKDDGGSEAPEGAPEIRDVTGKFDVAEFKAKVNGKDLTKADFADSTVYRIETDAVNSKGTVKNDKYSGYAIKDVLEIAGAPDAKKIVAKASDGYEVEIEITDENAPYILVAFEKNKEAAADGSVWVAPCLEKTTNNYCQMVVEIAVVE